ncbi:MAG TPA: hypothetical protein ENK17_02900, partial [Anaerolineae bacterium]|nr:hypothetical protein [Anaerolineae bacterium]
TLRRLREIIAEDPAVVEGLEVTGRNAGRFRFVEAEITVRVRELEQAETVTRRGERRIRGEVPYVDRVLIHAEPVRRTHCKYAVPLADTSGAVSEHYGDAPYFALVTVRLSDGTVEEQQIVSNPYLAEEKAKGIRVAEWLLGYKVDVVLSRADVQGRGPVYVLGNAGVELRRTEAATLTEALEEQQRDSEEERQ